MKVTKRDAEEILRQVRERFAPWIDGDDGPTLVLDWDFLGFGPTPTVVWEDGPIDWAITASLGGVNPEEAALYADAAAEFGILSSPTRHEPVGTADTYGEPATGWALSLYRR